MADAGAGVAQAGATTWLSRGFETLLYELAQPAQPDYYPFDVVIVGSGYGGAIAAAELAGCTKAGGKPVTVCVLERGKEYLPGMFPSYLSDLPIHVRFSTPSGEVRGLRESLFDVRIGRHASALLANGLGGGSLINAGVMEKPLGVMREDWPGSVGAELEAQYLDDALDLLGARGNFIGGNPKGTPAKYVALERLAPGATRQAQITVAIADGPNRDGVALQACKQCGDCFTGCNHESKNSLDVGPLARAQAAGARLYTGATVLHIERDADKGLWVLHTAHTDAQLRKRQGPPKRLEARKVILAAGTFGSTEILMRSAGDALRFSTQLGSRFSTNGDTLAAIYGQDRDVASVADGGTPPDARRVGPTITGLIDLRNPSTGEGHVIEEIAIPAALRRAFEEVVTTAKVLHELGTTDCKEHLPSEPPHDPCAVNGDAVGKTSIVVMMGNDGAAGRLQLADAADRERDGAITVQWETLPQHELFGRQHDTLELLARRIWPSSLVIPNPLWQPFPPPMRELFGAESGPALTVHPLGGCPMGRNADDGVVDDLGQVFDAGAGPGTTSSHDGLVVLDGSIVRRALGINPALTIAALALRAVQTLRGKWGFMPPGSRPAIARPRPRFKKAPQRDRVGATEIEVIERMSGAALVKGRDGADVRCIVELTLHFDRRAIGSLVLPADASGNVPMKRELKVREGRLRVFREDRWLEWSRSGQPARELDDRFEVEAALDGRLRLLDREASAPWRRIGRALRAWLINRGLRDAWQTLRPLEHEKSDRPGGNSVSKLFRRFWMAIALASRAGEVRQLHYVLHISGAPKPGHAPVLPVERFAVGEKVEGVKRLTYGRRTNPWLQLMRMTLRELPALASKDPVLELDMRYLAEIRVPLFRIVSQSDQVSALADLGSLLAYFFRLIFSIHAWAFRKPDVAVRRPRHRLPEAVPGRLPNMQEEWIQCLDDRGNPAHVVVGGRQEPVRVKLSRFCPPNPSGVPLVLIHGYSASGNTFTHHAINPNMAEHFYNRGRDVWVVDLRTSSGLPTALHPWRFEDAGLQDIPRAIARVCHATKKSQVDVFAHCMGSAMFSMAVLSAARPGPLAKERGELPGRIRKAVLSQIAPAVVMSATNAFRGYVMSYLRHFLPMEDYQFEASANPSLAEQLLDRLLATLPYPEEEFDVENPPWPPCRRAPFVGTRHRMDALYGRDFSLAGKDRKPRISDDVLAHIDDLFGPLSIETVSQAIHFARTQLITNHQGRNEYVVPSQVAANWTFPTLSVHGEENGLADVATLRWFKQRFDEDCVVPVEILPFPEFGHQDCLIGKDAKQVFDAVTVFLEA